MEIVFNVISHSNLSQGMVDTLEMIMGKQTNVSSICAYMNDVDYEKEIITFLEENKGKKIILCTDLFGGSVNNFLMNISNKYDFHLISGINLLCLMQLTFLDPNTSSIDDDITKVVNEAKEGMVYCNTIVNNNMESEDF